MDSYNSLLHVSTAGFIAGGIVAAAGITILLWPETRGSKSNVGILAGPNAFALKGWF